LWEDELVLGEFYGELAVSLDSVYRAGLPEPAMLAARDSIFAKARELLAGAVKSRLQVYSAKGLLSQPLNNATVVAARFYRTGLPVFDRVLDSRGGDLRRTVADIVAAVESDSEDPFDVVARLAAPVASGAPDNGAGR
jgi:predicted aminopeptidase